MSKENKDFTMEIQKGFDFILEESGNSSINLRKVSWNGREPKIDIRRWSYQDGTERALRGVTLTDEGANELTNVLVDEGYGDTKRLIKSIAERKDYNDIMEHINDPDVEIDDLTEEYYDPSELLGEVYEG